MGQQSSIELQFRFDSPPSTPASSPRHGEMSSGRSSPSVIEHQEISFYSSSQEVISCVEDWAHSPYGHYLLFTIMDPLFVKSLEKIQTHSSFMSWLHKANNHVQYKLEQLHRTGLSRDPQLYWESSHSRLYPLADSQQTHDKQHDNDLVLHRYRAMQSMAEYYQMQVDLYRYLPRKLRTTDIIEERIDKIEHCQQVSKMAFRIAHQYLRCIEYHRLH
jgi:hypothetical protein